MDSKPLRPWGNLSEEHIRVRYRGMQGDHYFIYYPLVLDYSPGPILLNHQKIGVLHGVLSVTHGQGTC